MRPDDPSTTLDAVTPEQLGYLDAIRDERVRPMGCIAGPIVGAMLLASTVFWHLNRWAALACAVIGVFVVSLPRLGWRMYMRRFDGSARPHRRIECPVPGGAPLIYRAVRDDVSNERLLLPLAVAGLEVRPGLPPVLDPAFDVTLGLKGSDVQRALLGAALRREAAEWHRAFWFVIDDDGARVRIGGAWLDPHSAAMQAIAAAVDAYRQRLSEPAFAALCRMARDLTEPFDAARALAVLGRDWGTQLGSLSRELDTQPLGRIINRIALTGDGLDAPALTWPQRSAIGRGLLGVKCPARTRLLAVIEGLTPTDEAAAMAIVELAEASAFVAGAERFEGVRSRAEALIADRGGPACLDWLRARARRDAAHQPLLAAVSARIQAETSGLLSLGDASADGGLSEAADAGGVTLFADPEG